LDEQEAKLKTAEVTVVQLEAEIELLRGHRLENKEMKDEVASLE